jgi:Protein of unknown function (DUF3179)
VVYDPMMNGERIIFGVSGLLYQRNLLMYDRATTSLWSQLGMKAVAGSLSGSSLPVLTAEHTTWGEWRTRYPDTTVLSFRTGYSRDYDRDPYRDMPLDRREAVAVFAGDAVKLYPLSELAKATQPIEDEVNGSRLRIDYDRQSRRLTIRDDSGGEVRHFTAFLADLRVFYPDAERYQAESR